MFVSHHQSRPAISDHYHSKPVTAYLRKLSDTLQSPDSSDPQQVQTAVNVCAWQLRQFAARQWDAYYPFLSGYDPVLANRLEDRTLKFAAALERLECTAHGATLKQSRSCIPAPTVKQLWRVFNRDYRAFLAEQAATLLPILGRHGITPVPGTPNQLGSIL